MPPSLTEKLKSLGITIGASDISTPQSKAAPGTPIEDVVDGRYLSTRRGETFLVEQTYPIGYRHGRIALQLDGHLEVIAAWAQEARLLELPPESFVFLDTETSGLAGGTGTYAFLIGIGRFVQDEFRLSQFFMRDPVDEPALLEALADFLAPCAAMVTFNGKAFDAPLLKTRYIMHSIPNPFVNFSHVDLLPLTRRLWRDRLPSRALKYLEENILGIPRTAEEVPAWEIPYLYFDYLRSGQAVPLKGVFYHNAMDIITLAALMSYIGRLLADPLNGSIEHGLDLIAMAKLFEDVNRWDESARLFERGLQMELPEEDFWLALRRLSILQRRRGDLESAVKLWEQAADEGHIYAYIELAKYHEHRRRDPGEALNWTRKAIGIVDKSNYPIYIIQYWQKELHHRHSRLEKKCIKIQ